MKDYKQKYEQALEKAKRCYKDLSNLDGMVATMSKDFFEEIFPELKKSEDERIKKGIIEYLEQSQFGEEHYQIDDDIVRGYITWLEKQGNQKQDVNYPKFNFDDVLALQCCVEIIKKSQKDKELYEQLQNLHDRVHDAYWFEKQDEQRPNNKVKPKFKVDDWIYHEIRRNTFHINKIENDLYISDEGATISLGRQNDWRIWTIKDARNGDVLAADGGNVCLFDGTVEEGIYPFAYCGITKYGFEFYDRKLPFIHDYVYPANKLQRDILFKKMKEAGYEWNDEKKELKKIEHTLKLTEE